MDGQAIPQILIGAFDSGQTTAIALRIFGSGWLLRSKLAGCLAIRRPNSSGCHQHGHWMGATAARDWQRGAGQDGRSPAEGDFRRTPCLAVTEDQAGLYFARPGRRTCRARAEGRLPFGMGVRPCREAQLQKKAWWLANAIVPTSPDDEPSGSNIKIGSNLSVWSSSTRPGPEPIWRPCGDGRHAAAGSPPRFHTAAGRP